MIGAAGDDEGGVEKPLARVAPRGALRAKGVRHRITESRDEQRLRHHHDGLAAQALDLVGAHHAAVLDAVRHRRRAMLVDGLLQRLNRKIHCRIADGVNGQGPAGIRRLQRTCSHLLRIPLEVSVMGAAGVILRECGGGT